MDNEEDKKRLAEIHATQKIEECISDIFINDNLIEAIRKCREVFVIALNLFEIGKFDNGSNNLDDLIYLSTKHWSNDFTNGKELYLERYIFDNFSMDFCEPKSIDRRIFKRIATAKLFGIPKKRIFDCVPAILISDYFPKVNDALQIQINEFTTVEDILHIWQEVIWKQNKFKWSPENKDFNPYSGVKGKKEYPSRERNDEVYKIAKEHPEFTRQQILDELSKRDYNADFSVTNISMILKREKKRRQKI